MNIHVSHSVVIILFVVFEAFLPSTFAMYMVLLSYGGWFAGNYTVSSSAGQFAWYLTLNETPTVYLVR